MSADSSSTGGIDGDDGTADNFKRLQQQAQAINSNTLLLQQLQQQQQDGTLLHQRHETAPVMVRSQPTSPHHQPLSSLPSDSIIQLQQQMHPSSHSAPQSPQIIPASEPPLGSHVHFGDPTADLNHSYVSLPGSVSPNLDLSSVLNASSGAQNAGIGITLLPATSVPPSASTLANMERNQQSIGAESMDGVPTIVATAGLTTGTTSGTTQSTGGGVLLGNQYMELHETTRSTDSAGSQSGNTVTSGTSAAQQQQPPAKYTQGSSISGTYLNASTIEQMTQQMVKNTNLDETERIIDVSPNGRYAKLNVLLGKGAHKVVYKCIDREEGYECAWNTVQTTRAEFNELSPEIEILKRVKHPNIINFHDCWYNNGEFIFITELMTSGTLREYIRKLQKPNYKVIKRWCRQILKGLLYLHSHDPPIIHRDIKCDNIFINGAHGEVKIGDMGTAEMKFGQKYTVIGTPEFMAPEMYEERGYNEKVDVYAFGMCLLEMVTGEYPYSECTNAAQIYKRVTSGIKPDGLNRVTDPEIYDLVCRCLANEDERITVQQGLEHPFLAVEPEVVLLSANETKTQLTLQVVFKGMDKLSAKFEFNTETDTAEEVVREMIEENVLPQKFQTLITHEINRILRDLNKLASEIKKEEKAPWRRSDAIVKDELERTRRELQMMHDRAAEAEKKAELLEVRARLAEEKTKSLAPSTTAPGSAAVATTTVQTGTESHQQQMQQSQPPPLQQIKSSATITTVSPARDSSSSPINSNGNSTEHLNTLASAQQQTQQPRPGSGQQQSTVQQQYEEAVAPAVKEYRDDQPIDDLVRDTALANNRGQDKAQEWLQRLNAQDIMTVGDLRDLHEQDWSSLGLTVFASRALRNALLGKNPRNISPKTMSKSVVLSSTSSAASPSTIPMTTTGVTGTSVVAADDGTQTTAADGMTIANAQQESSSQLQNDPSHDDPPSDGR